ncbi:oligopeptide transporter, OPT family [Corynebacterium macginleyi]|uniref:Oligopeptide transporter, OPT family n=1 Tax=Corynebacterium macginleyi TaxID=38290 RepID=A0ABS1Y7W2_9CORY|nr:oligopeptide transporter, OPT family [Corynebacterium macginleyi]MBK4137735.1 oligopeptide transporter, OPT family [Corynebacterium macginleyi]MBK4147167.1 oligopeptide transporter, OPT family [Corynebacterium macginleyi]MBK4147682.1 oligopeptide transporter, OPT family [Corynebacterium macginleyi]MBK4149893.1 oligopeptide transporter, OPT family [Corynebacterium macginleyi]MBK4152320.1 oligopeptide transporter, OPT family [Corynebacterium macginleyi]
MATMQDPAAGSQASLPELTLRGVIIGGLITLIFTAANVYLGLKVGLTFATSIPAAVISMAVLRRFAGHNIKENNIVQTIASAAGTLSAIIFVLPGLVMVGYWQGFGFFATAGVCMIGGVLGVMYSIPLRRALVTGSNLPYPEGVAAAEVLRVGDGNGDGASHGENAKGLRVIVVGGLISAAMALLSSMKAAAAEVFTYFKLGAGATTLGASLSTALIGVGHLVGLQVGIAMLVGVVISYFILLPIRTAGDVGPAAALADVVDATFANDIRFIGVGTMAIAAMWTLIKIAGPITVGIRQSLASSRTRKSGGTVDVTERDIPFPYVATTIVVLMVPIALLLWDFVQGTDIHDHMLVLITVSVLFTLLVGLIIASVCGYMAGLIGASNSPISSIGVIAVLTASLVIATVTRGTSAEPLSLVAYTLFTAAIVFGIATISNDNLQDLKTGQLVGATPWKQQVALIIGVVFGSLVIPPVLQLMLTGFGFQGMEGVGEDALAAPQAALMSSVASGIFENSLNWSLIFTGMGIGAVLIIVDECLKKFTANSSLSPLAAGMGMYLPVALTVVIPLGAILGTFYNKWAARQSRPKFAKRMGTLLATGLIVGESLFGVVNAAIIAASGGNSPLEVFSGGTFATVFGIVLFIAALSFIYRWTARKVHAPKQTENPGQAGADKR